MRLPFTPNHVRLIQDCYPPSSALLATGPDYRPNSQELSRLTYYASNRPGKLAKLGKELEKRARLEAQRARSGNARARASLLITLAIFKALVTECRRDLSLLTPSLIASVVASLTCLPRDLEVAARSATVFTAWTTYTDGHLIGVDSDLTTGYKSTLRCFTELSRIPAEKGDGEVRNRKRLVGIGALTGVVASDALYHTSSEFPSQVSIIVPGLLLTLQEADFEVVRDEAIAVKHQPSASSAYLSEFNPRPLAERRAASIHVHIDGERGPSFSDVVNASLRAFQYLLERSNAHQVSAILQAAFDDAETGKWWENTPLWCWLVQTTADWAQYQYRYAVPKQLVEKLVQVQDSLTPTPMHFTLARMIETVLNSPTPLVNLSTSDIMSYLLALLTRRVSINPDDGLLSSLVNCTAALGAHVYYQDQIHDLAEELVGRLVSVQVNGLFGRGRGDTERGRDQGMRCLIAVLRGLLRTADRHAKIPMSPTSPTSLKTSSSADKDMDRHSERNLFTGPGPQGKSRRTRVSPEIWQDSLAVLSEVDYGVRDGYARALVEFIKFEVHKEPYALHVDSSMDRSGDVQANKTAPILSVRRATPGVITADPISRFLNALHASIFILATSSTLGLTSTPTGSTRSSSQQLQAPPTLNVIAATPTGTPGKDGKNTSLSMDLPEEPSSPSQTGPFQSQQSSRSRHSISQSPSRQRRLSVPLTLLNPGTSYGWSPAATPSDYSHLVNILTSMHECLPGRALLTGVPMLFALDALTMQQGEEVEYAFAKRRAVRELLARVWMTIGQVWECKEVIDMAEKASGSLGSPFALPAVPPAPLELFDHPEVPLDWSAVQNVDGIEAFDTSRPFIDPELVVQALAGSHNVHIVTGLDRQALLRRLSLEWTLEYALKDSIERQSNNDILRGDGISPFLKISPALMHIENLSLQSLARTQHAAGVHDLREALEGRGSASNLALNSTRPSSIRTLEQQSIISERQHSTGTQIPPNHAIRNGSKDVHEMLNKLGVGKQNGNSSLLKASFPALQRRDTRKSKASIISPPYHT